MEAIQTKRVKSIKDRYLQQIMHFRYAPNYYETTT